MIINGASRRSVAFWSRHLMDQKKNDRVTIKEIRGLASETLRDALLEMQEDAKHTRLTNFFYSANFNVPVGTTLSDDQWDQAFAIFEKRRGIPEGTPRVVIEHEKKGRVHRHVVWARLDPETMRAWPDGYDARVCHAASREAAQELGLDHSPSPFDKDREGPRPERAPKSYEMFRGLQSGIDPREMKAEVTEVFRQSDNATEFVNGLRMHGYEVVQGDRRDYCILDAAGEVHSLARRIAGVNAKDLRAFMGSMDRNSVPTIIQAKARLSERVTEGRLADFATVRHEIEWEEQLALAAIEKEKVEATFVEPSAAELKTREEAKRRWPIEPPYSEATKTSPKYHFEDAAREVHNPEPLPQMPPNLRGTSKHIWEAYRASDSPKAFAAALNEHQIALAIATKEEADKSHRDSTFARAVGGYLPRYAESEIVAVTERGAVYRISHRNTGEEAWRIGQFLKGVDRSQLLGIEATKEAQTQRAEQRIAEVQAFRDVLRDMRAAERLQDALTPPASANRGEGTTRRNVEKAARSGFDKARRGASLPLDGALGVTKIVADAFSNLLAPPVTKQQRIEKEIDTREREASSARRDVEQASQVGQGHRRESENEIHRGDSRER